MTKERKLAIQMWEEIYVRIRDEPHPKDIDCGFITSIKLFFCSKHNLRWAHSCWLCQYVRYRDDGHGEGCQRCPLSDGHKGAIIGYESGCSKNAYSRVISARQRKTKLQACDEIIRILNGRLK